jgi:nucleoporin NUP42
MSDVLPPSVLEAFKGQKFEWGKVPEWVPPLELR